jgi:sphinganine-1-phosphate aldolase
MLPPSGRSEAELLNELERIRARDSAPLPPKTAGRLTAERAYLAMLDVDCLDPMESPSVLELERGVIAAVASKLGGDCSTPGIVTGGGTESIILAVKAARDSRPDLAQPRMVVPVTAHAAFHKAAAYLGMVIDTVPVDATTCRPEPAGIAAALTGETVLIGLSAPSAGHGVIDPVPEIAAIVQERGILCHVDACAGWILPWMAEAGADIPPFDLAVPGVTSISCDLHKFGDVPKAVSVLLFAGSELRRAAYYACARWSGYTMVTPTVQSSRSAGPLAGAWAGLQVTGASGYRRLGEQILRATTAFLHAAETLPGLTLLGRPHGPVISWAADDPDLDPFVLCDEARQRGVLLSAQAGVPGLPHSLRLSLSRTSEDEVPDLRQRLRASIDAALRSGDAVTDSTLVEAVSSLNLAGLADDDFERLVRSLGVDDSTGSEGGAAGINRLLCTLPPPLREGAMLRFFASLPVSRHETVNASTNGRR